MKLFNLGNGFSAVCESKPTRSGFKHVASLLINGIKCDEVKICYINRTWESFQYESVLYRLVEKSSNINPAQKHAILTVTLPSFR